MRRRCLLPLLLAGVFLLLALGRAGGSPWSGASLHDERVEIASETDRRGMTAGHVEAAGPDARSGPLPSRDTADESSSRLVGDTGDDDELDADEDDVGVPWTGADARAIRRATALAPKRTRSPPLRPASLDPPQRPPIG